MTNEPISCELYDYIEIACTFHYPVKLKLMSGEVFEGVAKDTFVDENKNESLIFLKKDIQESINIIINDISQMQSLIKNPHFDTVNFSIKQC